MNKERILELADTIEQHQLPEVDFDMTRYWERRGCRTAGCIAGHAAAKWEPERWNEYVNGTTVDFIPGLFEVGQDILDLSFCDAANLFLPAIVDLDRVTPQIAAQVLRTFAHTGRIEWPDEVIE